LPRIAIDATAFDEMAARCEEMPDPFYEDCFVKVARVEFLSDVEVGFVRYRGRSPESPSIRASLKTAPHAAYA
jgi:hypothetical protein